MKNTEVTFYSLKQFEYLPLNVRSIRDSAEVFCLFSMYLKDKAFKYLKNQSFFLAISSNVSYIPRHQVRQSR